MDNLSSQKPYEPKGIKFIDENSGREMILIDENEASFGNWIAYKHPDGQWVSVKTASLEEIKKIRRLHVYKNEKRLLYWSEWVFAYSPKDAEEVWLDYWGHELPYYSDEDGEFEQVPDESEFTFVSEEPLKNGEIPPTAILMIEESPTKFKYRATCRAWAEISKRGYFASSEY